VVDPQRMMCTYGPAQGFLLNHSYMHGVCRSISSQYAVAEALLSLKADDQSLYVRIYLTYRSLGLVTVVTAVTTFRRGGLPLSWGHTHVFSSAYSVGKGVPLYLGIGGDGGEENAIQRRHSTATIRRIDVDTPWSPSSAVHRRLISRVKGSTTRLEGTLN
jgi:hypothetical protein